MNNPIYFLVGAGFMLGVLMVCPRPQHTNEDRWHAGTALWPLTLIAAFVLVVAEWLRRC
jgi:hypothetical protein